MTWRIHRKFPISKERTLGNFIRMSLQLCRTFCRHRCWFQWLISRWILLRKTDYHHQKFKAHLNQRLFVWSFGIVQLLICMISSTEEVFYVNTASTSCICSSSVQFSSVQQFIRTQVVPKKYNSNTHIQTQKVKSTSTKDLNTITVQWHNKVVES